MKYGILCKNEYALLCEDYSKIKKGNACLYAASALFPFAGVLLGCIYLAKNKNELSSSFFLTAASSLIFLAIFCFILILFIS